MDTNALRVLVEAVDHAMPRLPGPVGAAQAPRDGALRASWGKLVEFLALGPAPEMRDCPHCGRSGMRAATRCGYCWEKLPSLAPPGTGLAGGEGAQKVTDLVAKLAKDDGELRRTNEEAKKRVAEMSGS